MIAGKEHSSGPLIILPFWAALDVKVGNRNTCPQNIIFQAKVGMQQPSNPSMSRCAPMTSPFSTIKSRAHSKSHEIWRTKKLSN
ncbi:hypothetical protein TNIN_268601 [Trichonephila inaurata madagascariensis]|uniref:Uncharacterized protein n=1 Tax=Trichonephila inaurata madagascariensis TaxID=2747483 RepID=A0A8X6I7W9_9ARAC|nr:hypothetical protein TNIN_268601 [Trichonephila inaurata madagascariensis]